mmetsp:Transcript_32097/g.74771  ORF Transcript_32097/g.74771 Transcript_32097/m.74771 type:complete len:270 (+) Transcript_32097:536-1345(+)
MRLTRFDGIRPIGASGRCGDASGDSPKKEEVSCLRDAESSESEKMERLWSSGPEGLITGRCSSEGAWPTAQMPNVASKSSWSRWCQLRTAKFKSARLCPASRFHTPNPVASLFAATVLSSCPSAFMRSSLATRAVATVSAQQSKMRARSASEVRPRTRSARRRAARSAPHALTDRDRAVRRERSVRADDATCRRRSRACRAWSDASGTESDATPPVPGRKSPSQERGASAASAILRGGGAWGERRMESGGGRECTRGDAATRDDPLASS